MIEAHRKEMDYQKEAKKAQPFLLLALISIVTTFILWLPFLLRLPEFWGIKLPQGGMATVVANFDGPYYIVAAKSLYNPTFIEENFSFPLPAIYYSAHFPLFPLLIRAFSTVLGYPYAMMVVTLLTSVLAVWMFYILLNDLGIRRYALFLAMLFTVFPARWLIVRSIGSPEPLFLFALMAAVYYFRKQRWWLAAIFGSLAQATKSPGILLFISFVVALILPNWPKLAHTKALAWLRSLPWKAYPIFLIPLTLLLIYTWYGLQYDDFFAYFNSGDNIHLTFPPFQVFNPGQAWVGTFWLEEVIWLYLMGAIGALYLIKQKRPVMASFVSVFFISTLFVSHRDIARYSLPLVPFLFIAFSKLLTNQISRWALIGIIIPIYLFSIAFITNNVTPIGNWGPLL